jgi:hypothetical protein
MRRVLRPRIALRLRQYFLAVAAALAFMGNAAAETGAPGRQVDVDYLTVPFTLERVLDWGERPVWSLDGTRIAFVPDDMAHGAAYELDLKTRTTRCLTCRWGINGGVRRIYYLPDDSFLIVGDRNLVTAAASREEKVNKDHMGTALYWMSKAANMPPQPLEAAANGEIAINYQLRYDGSIQIAWGEYSEVVGPNLRMFTGEIVHDGSRAALTNRRIVYVYPPADANSKVTHGETYDFIQGGKALLFFTVEKGYLTEGMYTLDLQSGNIARLPTDGAHSETHIFPDDRYGLQESNRASDTSSPIRGLTGHPVFGVEALLKRAGRHDAKELAERYGGRGFDLFAHHLVNNKYRRLTFVSDLGGQAHQSSPSRDGRRIVFAMIAPRSGPFAGKGGIYVGTFGSR